MIINWTSQMKSLQTTETDRDIIVNSIKQDLEIIKSTLFTGEKIILIFTSGSRYEIYPLFENGEFDIKNVTKDFNAIYQLNTLKTQILEKENEIRGLLKNNPDALSDFEEYLKLKHSPPLFNIDLYISNKVNKSYKKITYEAIETYIHGVLGSFGMIADKKYEGIQS